MNVDLSLSRLHAIPPHSPHAFTECPTMTQYFTDREFGERPRLIDAIDERLWAGLHSLIDTRIGDGSFRLSLSRAVS